MPSTGRLVPVAKDPRAAGLTYEPFYGLHQKPFSLTADSRFFYQSSAHAPAYDELLSAIRRRESLNVLTGDIGTGKTTLCRAVLSNLDRKTFSAFVPDPFASREDLLKILLIDFGVASVDDVTSGRLRSATRTELSYLLYEFLRTLAPLQAFAVAVIDEAQNLSVPLLEEVRILSDAGGLLQVVLVGQLDLRAKLTLPEMRQLNQRVSVHCQLSALDPAGVAGYIAHRLEQAGGSPDRVSFSSDAAEAIYERSGGVPRLVNRMCDRALQLGYTRRVSTIDRAIVEAANAASPADTPRATVASPPSVHEAAPVSTTTVVAQGPPMEPPPVAPEPPPRAEPPAVTAPVPPAARKQEHLEQWLTRIDAQPAPPPLLADWRRRWMPTDATIESEAARRHEGAPARLSRQTRRGTRRIAALAIGLVLLFGVLVVAAAGASVANRFSVQTPELPPRARPRLPPPAAPVPPPPDEPR